MRASVTTSTVPTTDGYTTCTTIFNLRALSSYNSFKNPHTSAITATKKDPVSTPVDPSENVYVVSGTSRGAILGGLVGKRFHTLLRSSNSTGSSTKKYERVLVVPRWEVLLSLQNGSMTSHRVALNRSDVPSSAGSAISIDLLAEPPIHMNETDVSSFAVDELTSSDRLCLGLKSKVLVLKRIHASHVMTSARFEMVAVLEVAHPPKALEWANGSDVSARWICASFENLTMWINTDVSSLSSKQQSASPALPAVDILCRGRNEREVLGTKGRVTRSLRPPAEDEASDAMAMHAFQVNELTWPDAPVLVHASRPYVVAVSAFDVWVGCLETGHVLQSLRVLNPPKSPPQRPQSSFINVHRKDPASSASDVPTTRWSVGFLDGLDESNRRLVAVHPLLGGGVAFTLTRESLDVVVLQTLLASKSISEIEFATAIALSQACHPAQNRWLGTVPPTASDRQSPPTLAAEAALSFVSRWLLGGSAAQRVSLESVSKANQLLFHTDPPLEITTQQWMDVLHHFVDTELFADDREASEVWSALLPDSTTSTKPCPSCGVVVAFDSRGPRGDHKCVSTLWEAGALGSAFRDVAAPCLGALRAALPARLALIDSLTLRALALGRPGKSASDAVIESYESRKQAFLSDPTNSCTIEESERLLLMFPDVWRDHASLLARKASRRAAWRFLQTLGENAAPEDDRYAVAALALLAQWTSASQDSAVPENEASDVLTQASLLEMSTWILRKHPRLGVEFLAASRRVADAPRAAAALEELAPGLGRGFLIATVRNRNGGINAVDALLLDLVRDLPAQEKNLWLYLQDPTLAYTAEALLPHLTARPRERACVLRRMGRVAEAVRLLTEIDAREAESYADSVEDVSVREDLFEQLIEDLVHKRRLDEACDVLRRKWARLNLATCLAKLPEEAEELTCGRVADIAAEALGTWSARRRQHLIRKQLMKHESLIAMTDLADAKADYVVLTKSTRCGKCFRPFQSDAAFVRVPLLRTAAGEEAPDFSSASAPFELYHIACFDGKLPEPESSSSSSISRN